MRVDPSQIVSSIILGLISGIMIMAIGLGSVFFFGEHNPVEKMAEKVLEKETGLEVDLDYKDY